MDCRIPPKSGPGPSRSQSFRVESVREKPVPPSRTRPVSQFNGQNMERKLFEEIKTEMDRGVMLAAQQHKIMMTRIVEENFLTERQIRNLHNQHSTLVTNAFEFSLSSLQIQNSPHPNVRTAFQGKLMVLKTVLDVQYFYYLRKHELFVENMIKKAKDAKGAAEQFYDQLMTNVMTKENLDAKSLEKSHEQNYDKVVQYYTKFLKENRFGAVEAWLPELEFSLLNKFENYQQILIQKNGELSACESKAGDSNGRDSRICTETNTEQNPEDVAAPSKGKSESVRGTGKEESSKKIAIRKVPKFFRLASSIFLKLKSKKS